MTFTAFDYILAAIAALALITGAMKGLVRQISSIAGLVAGVLVCRFFGEQTADFIIGSGSEHAATLRVLCYVLLFISVYVGISLLGRLAGAILTAIKLRGFDRLGGALFRTALWLFFISLILNIYLAAVPADRAKLCPPEQPWRHTVISIAPKVLGCIVNQDTTPLV